MTLLHYKTSIFPIRITGKLEIEILIFWPLGGVNSKTFFCSNYSPYGTWYVHEVSSKLTFNRESWFLSWTSYILVMDHRGSKNISKKCTSFSKMYLKNVPLFRWYKKIVSSKKWYKKIVSFFKFVPFQPTQFLSDSDIFL